MIKKTGSQVLKDIKQTTSIDYMIRTMQQHHVHLSEMADRKANIIIAANSILITLVIGTIDLQTPIWGLFSLCFFSMLALMFAILTVVPHFSKKQQDIAKAQKANVLFFGAFTNWNFDHFLKKMANIMSSTEKQYEAQLRDIYQLGLVLKCKKYKYIKISYLLFFTGIIVSMLLFSIQSILNYI